MRPPQHTGFIPLLLLLAILLATPLKAAEAKPSFDPDAPIGQWTGRTTTNQYSVDFTITIARSPKGHLVGQWSTQRESVALKLVDYKKGWFTFLRPIQFGNSNTNEMDFTGEINGDKLHGGLFIFNNVIEINATRTTTPNKTTTPNSTSPNPPSSSPPTPDSPAPTPSTPTTPPVLIGAWYGHVQTDTDAELRPIRLIIEKGQRGLIITHDQTLPISSLRLTDNKLRITLTTKTNDNPQTIHLQLTLENNQLQGQAFLDNNQTLGQIKLTKRAPE